MMTYRAIIALVYTIEIGWFFGWDHVKDRSAEECIAAGIALLLWSLAFRPKGDR